MEYNSPELQNIPETKQSIGPHTPPAISLEHLKNDLRLLACTKGINNIQHYESGYLNNISSNSGCEIIGKIVDLLESQLLSGIDVSDTNRYQITNYCYLIKRSLFGLERLNGAAATKDSIISSILGLITRNFL